MSCNYADGLSEYEDKGVLGVPEKFDGKEDVEHKCEKLYNLMKEAKHIVVHTGAGISTTAGIPDFRGPKGVWTLEKHGERPSTNVSFDTAVPTITHMVLKALVDAGKVQFIISQNIDGLHLRSGVPRSKIAELHGNMFIEQCDMCRRKFVMHSATTSVGQKFLGTNCRGSRAGRPCRGKPRDVVLDWEHDLPEPDLEISDKHASVADLNICLGTTLQVVPSGNLPLNNLKRGGKLVICNLQPTKHDKKAHLVINTYVDDILIYIAKKMGIDIPSYSPELDPTKMTTRIVDWTYRMHSIKEVKQMYNAKYRNKRYLSNDDEMKPDIKNIKIDKTDEENVEGLKEEMVTAKEESEKD